MGTTNIRWASVEDARGVAQVHVDSWRAAYAGLISPEVLDGLNVDQRAAAWADWIAASLTGASTDGESAHRLLVADVDGRIAAWSSFGAGRDEGAARIGEIAGIYAHPDYWSQRIGHALLKRVETELVAAGWTEAYLWALRGNERAIRFYERHDWLVDGGEKVGNVGGALGLHEIRFRRNLGVRATPPNGQRK